MATDPVGVVEWVCPECGSEWTSGQPASQVPMSYHAPHSNNDLIIYRLDTETEGSRIPEGPGL